MLLFLCSPALHGMRTFFKIQPVQDQQQEIKGSAEEQDVKAYLCMAKRSASPLEILNAAEMQPIIERLKNGSRLETKEIIEAEIKRVEERKAKGKGESYILDFYFKKNGLATICEDVWANCIISSDARIVKTLHKFQQNNNRVLLTPKQTALLWIFDEVAEMIQKPSGFNAGKMAEMGLTGLKGVALAIAVSRGYKVDSEIKETINDGIDIARRAKQKQKIVEFDLGTIARLLANKSLKGTNASPVEYQNRVEEIYKDAEQILNSFQPVVKQAIEAHYKITRKGIVVHHDTPIGRIYKKQEEQRPPTLWQKFTSPWVLGSAVVCAVTVAAGLWCWLKK